MAFLLVTARLGAAPGEALETVAGTGTAGYAGDGGAAAAARLDQPFHCSFGPAGALFIADTFNHCIRRVDPATGKISTVAGSGRKGYSGDGGPAVAAALNEPYGVAADAQGNLFIVDRLNACIRRVDATTGVITTLAGTGKPGYGGDGGPAVKAPLREPNGLALDGRGGLFIADVSDNRIRKVDLATGIITTVAGTGRREFGGDGGPAAAAAINGARAVAVGPRGDLFICEREGNRIRQVDAAGTIRTIAGTGAAGYSGDGGPALQATFRGPKWVDVDPEGAIFVVDTENHCVRRIDPQTHRITTVVGSGQPGPAGDGGQPLDAQLDRPHGSTTRRGLLYVADTNNHRIRVCPIGRRPDASPALRTANPQSNE